jgi:cytochrome c-type biogenesis protein CcmE
MTRKRRRLYLVVALVAVLGIATALVLTAFQDSLVYFYSPSDIAAKHPGVDRRFRLGGLVKPGSVEKDGGTTAFVVTDLKNEVPVRFTGLLPDLFREGQGVVTQGRFDARGQFIAQDVLAKHDEKYMPPEVADALKKSGEWRPETAGKTGG